MGGRFSTDILNGRKIDHPRGDFGHEFCFLECWDLLCVLPRFDNVTVRNKSSTLLGMNDDEVTQAGEGYSSLGPERSMSDDENDIKDEKKVGISKKCPLARQEAKHLAAGDAATNKKTLTCRGCRSFPNETCGGEYMEKRYEAIHEWSTWPEL